MSVFGVFLVRLFPQSDWMRRDTQSECGKIRTKKKHGWESKLRVHFSEDKATPLNWHWVGLTKYLVAIFLKQPASTWSKSTIGTPTKCVKHFSNLTIKASKWYHSCRFVVFIINFEQIPFLSLNKWMLKGKVFYRYLQLAKNFCIYIQLFNKRKYLLQ